MKKFRLSDSQIMAILKQHEAGLSVVDLSREHCVSTALIYQWRSKYGCINDEAPEGAGGRERTAEEDVCRRTN